MRRRATTVSILLILAMSACGGGDDAGSSSNATTPRGSSSSTATVSDGSAVLTAMQVADRVEAADMGCSDARANPEPEDGVTDSVVCTLKSGTGLTIDAFRDEAALKEFEDLGKTGCAFYPEGLKIPYVKGRWWTASVDIEMSELGSGDFDLDLHDQIGEATGGEVATVSC